MEFNNAFNNAKVIFLEIGDFNNGVLTYKGRPLQGKVLVMVQGDFCGFCTKSKPAFVNLANSMGTKTLGPRSTVFATIKIDGKKSESDLSAKLPQITKQELKGVPVYLLFLNGHFVAIHNDGRDEASLKNFLNSY